MAPQAAQQTGDLRGICVSGDQDVIGSVYIAPEIYAPGVAELTDFVAGDILVCKMMNPAWLPYVLQSKAVICEVGGWLSHMAIVAREHNIPMIVGCQGLNRLQNGMDVKIMKSGAVEVLNDAVEEIKCVNVGRL